MTNTDKIKRLAVEVMGWKLRTVGHPVDLRVIADTGDGKVCIAGKSITTRHWNPLESVTDAMEVAMRFECVNIHKPLHDPAWMTTEWWYVTLDRKGRSGSVEDPSLCRAICDAALLGIGVKREEL